MLTRKGVEAVARLWSRRGDKPALADEHQRLQDYRRVFGGDAGHRVLADICRRNHVAQSSFAPGAPDVSAFQEGRRRAALEIIETINRDPEVIARMIAEGETAALEAE